MRVNRYLLAGALCLGAATAASAQVVYKSTMPNGEVIYSEKPVAGAARVETISPPPPRTGTVIINPEEQKQLEQRLEKRAAETAKREKARSEARRELEQAEAARATGKEPLPGERLGVAGGGTRLSDAYWERQKQLEEAVQAARKKVDDTGR